MLDELPHGVSTEAKTLDRSFGYQPYESTFNARAWAVSLAGEFQGAHGGEGHAPGEVLFCVHAGLEEVWITRMEATLRPAEDQEEER